MQVGVIEAHIRTVGLAPTKARNLKAMSQVRACPRLGSLHLYWTACALLHCLQSDQAQLLKLQILQQVLGGAQRSAAISRSKSLSMAR